MINSFRFYLAAAATKSLQSCPTLCDLIDSTTRVPRPWDSPGKNTGVGCHFLLQCMKVKSETEVIQRVRLFVTPWTAAHQAPPSMVFPRQECWSGVPLPSPGNSFIFQMFLMIGDSRYRNFLLFLKVRDSSYRISGGLLLFIVHL